MTLPNVLRSGVTSSSSCPPPRATRKPVITSSRISRAPTRSHSARSPLRNPALGGDEAHVGGDRLDDHAGGLLVELRHDVVGRDDRVGHRRLGDARRPGQAEGSQPGAGLGQGGGRRGRGSCPRTSRPCADRCGRAPRGRRTWSPRCRKPRAAPARPTARARRSPRPAAPRARSARRRRCRRRPLAARPRRWPGWAWPAMTAP